jgi:hypothetical protein
VENNYSIINSAQDMFQWPALVNVIMNLCGSQKVLCLTSPDYTINSCCFPRSAPISFPYFSQSQYWLIILFDNMCDLQILEQIFMKLWSFNSSFVNKKLQGSGWNCAYALYSRGPAFRSTAHQLPWLGFIVLFFISYRQTTKLSLKLRKSQF